VTVELGTGIDNAFPRVPVDVARGDVIDVVGRVRETAPTEIIVRGLRRGAPFEQTITVDTRRTDEAADLRLRWANERLRQLLLGGASREEIAELGTRCGLITPYTSYYVPSAREMSSGMYGALTNELMHVPLLDPRWRMSEEDTSAGETLAEAALTIALGPLALTGCCFSASGEAEMPAVLGPSSSSDQGQTAPAVAPAEAPGYWGAEAEEAAPAAPAVAGQPVGTWNAPMPASSAPTAATAPVMPPSAEPSPTEGDFGGLRGAGGGSGGGGMGQGSGATRREAAAADPSDIDDLLAGALGPSTGTTTGSSAPSGRVQRERAPDPDAARRPARLAEIETQREQTEERNRRADRGENAELRGDLADGFADFERSTTTRTTITTTVTTTASHQRQRCSDASRTSLDDRRALWTERLGQTDYVGSWVETYREAARRCEIATSRDRRVFLEALLDRAGSLPRMVELYSYLPDASARGFFRSAILRRVRTADDLRLVRNAFGLSTGIDWSLVEQEI
jgi:Ca-activated chloride channel family protein